MRIISKFHDYYDGCMRHGIDMKCVYQRVTQEIHDPKDFPVSFEMIERLQWHIPARYRAWEVPYDNGMIWFCGKVYPYILLYGGQTMRINSLGYSVPGERELVYCYNAKEAADIILAHGSKEEKARFDLKRRVSIRKSTKTITNRELAVRFFSLNQGWQPEKVIEILCKIGAPVLQFIPTYRHSSPKLVLSPCLKDLQFFKVFDPYTAYQEIAMFVSGVMGGQAPPMVPVSDEVRLEKHGFDRKWSFRKKVR